MDTIPYSIKIIGEPDFIASPTPEQKALAAQAAAVALRFAEALARGDYATAGDMLSAESAERYPDDELQSVYEDMLDDGDSAATQCTVEGLMLDNAEGRLAAENAIAWVYVSMGDDDGFNEAVSVNVTPDLKIDIDDDGWGRP